MPSTLRGRARSAALEAVTSVRDSINATIGRPRDAWTAADIPDQSGRTVLVTGGNSGLGLQSCLTLARAGARVLLTARDDRRGELARARVAAVATGPAPEVIGLDLADLRSVGAAAAQVAGTTPSLDVVIANAGVMMTPLTRTDDGFELQLATNHLGHFALLGQLLPLLGARADVVASRPHPRVVVVSSIAARVGRVMLSDLQFDRRPYNPFTAYAQSKLANLLFARELQQRADAAGRPLVVAAAHPGLTTTNLYPRSVLGDNALLRTATGAVIGTLGQDDADGALPLLYAATVPGVSAGAYLGPSGLASFQGAPAPVRLPPTACDDASAAALWLVSENLTGVRYRWH